MQSVKGTLQLGIFSPEIPGAIAEEEDEVSPEEDVGSEWNETIPENIDSNLDLQEG